MLPKLFLQLCLGLYCYQIHYDNLVSVQKQFLHFALRHSDMLSLPQYNSHFKLINQPTLTSLREILNGTVLLSFFFFSLV